MKSQGVCKSCQREAEVAFVQFRSITGLLFVAIRNTKSGIMCESCAARVYNRTTLHNLILGWWSGPSLIGTPILLAQNSTEWKRARAEFAASASQTSAQTQIADSPEDSSVLTQLPWAPLIGIPARGSSIGSQKLTAPVAIGALTGIVAFVSLIGVIVMSITDGANTPHQAAVLRAVWWSALVTSILVISLCFFLHKKRNTIANRAPDILASMLPADSIFQVDRVQVAALAFERKGAVRMVLLAQNCAASQSIVECGIQFGSSTYRAKITLAAAEVALTYIYLPHPNAAVAQLSLTFTARSASSLDVRPLSRPFLSNSRREAMRSVAMAAGGHFNFALSSGVPGTLGFMNRLSQIKVNVGEGDSRPPAEPKWQRVSLWTPAAPHPPIVSASVLIKLLERSLPERA